MRTIDDRRTREALVATYAQFQVPQRFCQGNYQKGDANCLMGAIARHLGLEVTLSQRFRQDPLYASIINWFELLLGCDFAPLSPEHWADLVSRDSVLSFLEARISDLDAALLMATSADPTPALVLR